MIGEETPILKALKTLQLFTEVSEKFKLASDIFL